MELLKRLKAEKMQKNEGHNYAQTFQYFILLQKQKRKKKKEETNKNKKK